MTLLGCATLSAVCLLACGGLGVWFGYWWDSAHPTEFMNPRWDTLVLAFLPWLIGVILIGVGTLLGLVALVVGVVRRLRGSAADVTP